VLVQASALLYVAMARIATLDMSLSFGLQIAMTALALLVQRRARPRARSLAPAAAAGRGRGAGGDVQGPGRHPDTRRGRGAVHADPSRLAPAAARAAMVDAGGIAAAGGAVVRAGVGAQSGVRAFLLSSSSISSAI
jgi:hypothetical protein